MPTDAQFHFSEQDIAAYADLTQDFNPIHSDKAFAATTRLGQPIVFGTMSLALVMEVLEQQLGAQAASGCHIETRFVRPVFVGQSLRVALGHRDAAGMVSFSVFTGADDILAMSGQITWPGQEGARGEAADVANRKDLP